MTEVIVKYHVQNAKDKNVNWLILPTHKYPLMKTDELALLMLSKGLVTKNSHFRFKYLVEGQQVWIDSTSSSEPLPINKNGEVELKILEVPYVANPAVAVRPSQSEIKYAPVSKAAPKLVSSLQENITPKSHAQEPAKPESLFNGKSSLIDNDWGFDEGLDSSLKAGLHRTPMPTVQTDSTKGLNNIEDFVSQVTKPAINQPRASNPSASIPDDFISHPADIDILNTTEALPKTNVKTDTSNNFFSELEEVNIAGLSTSEALRDIESKIMSWAYSASVRKDIRTLLSTVQDVLWEGNSVWTPVTLTDILSEEALQQKISRAKLSLHPDKNSGLPADKRYILERVVSEIILSSREKRSR